MLILLLMISAHLLGIVVVGCSKFKKNSKTSTTKTKDTQSTTRSADNIPHDGKEGSDPATHRRAKTEGEGLSSNAKDKYAKMEEDMRKRVHELPQYEDYGQVPQIDETKRKVELEHERDQRTAHGELSREVDDTLDIVESIRVEESEDRTPAEHLKNVDWTKGHPDREKHLLRFEERKRYDEWNNKAQFLHRRHMRHLMLVKTMQSYQLSLLGKDTDAEATVPARNELQAQCDDWIAERCKEFAEQKHDRCPYRHSSEPNDCGDADHNERLAYVDWPAGEFPRRDDMIELDK